MPDDKIVVCGAGGFVGGALVDLLVASGHKNIVAVSSRPVDKWIRTLPRPQVTSLQLDLRGYVQCALAVEGADWVYNLASKVGGIGYIGNPSSMAESYLSASINLNLLSAIAASGGAAGYFFASSACVYGSASEQIDEDTRLSPSPGYGEEKAFSERAAISIGTKHNIPVYVARFTGVYGPGDDIKGREDRDHAPSALTRKVIRAKRFGPKEISIWGNGEQRRDFLYIDDCAQACYRLMGCGRPGVPVNVAGRECITMNEMATMLEDIAGVNLQRFFSSSAPTGVQSRHLCTDRLEEFTKWRPQVTIKEGLQALYQDLWNKSMKESIGWAQ